MTLVQSPWAGGTNHERSPWAGGTHHERSPCKGCAQLERTPQELHEEWARMEMVLEDPYWVCDPALAPDDDSTAIG